MSKPVIGLTMDSGKPSQEPGKFNYAKYVPWYALRQNYAEAISHHGGLPIMLPYHAEHNLQVLDLLDGLVVTGGDFDISPTHYGEKDSGARIINAPRTEFEWGLIKKAYNTDIPIFGICGGMQLLNVVLGGSMIQHIPDEVPGHVEHEQKNPHYEPVHEVHAPNKDTIIGEFLDGGSVSVNSTHHQAVDKLGEGLTVAATAPDGIVEAVENTNKRFCVAVQWHPEYQINKLDEFLFREFVLAAHSG